jgi:hypothetical protein
VPFYADVDDDLVERAKYYLDTVPLMVIDGCQLEVIGQLRFTGDWVNTLSLAPLIHVRLIRGALIHVYENATLEVNTGTASRYLI